MKFRNAALLSLVTLSSSTWFLWSIHRGSMVTCEAFLPPLTPSRGCHRLRSTPFPVATAPASTSTRLLSQPLNLDLYNAPPEQLDQWVSQQYEEWCRQYSKTPDYTKRYPLFKQNCLVQLNHDLQAGQDFMGLNEYGDLAPEEYLLVESKIRQDYEAWCREFGKTPSDYRFEIYRQNVLINIEYFQKTGALYHLNEFADLTEEEFQSMNSLSNDVQESGSTHPPSSGAGMSSFADSLSGGYGQVNQSGGYMPKSYEPTTGTGMPSYFDALVMTSSTNDVSNASVQNYSPASSPPAANRAASSAAGMSSFADSLSGGNLPMKQSSFMPTSYRQTSGSGMPSYFDSLSSDGNDSSSASGSYAAPEPTYPNPASSDDTTATNSNYKSGTPSGAGMASFADNLSGGYGQVKQGNGFMPTSYRQSSGSGMPSYFDTMQNNPFAATPTAHEPTYAQSEDPEASSSYNPASYESEPPSGAGMASFANSLSGGYGQMKQSSYMPKSYKTSSGTGMPSYFDSMTGNGAGSDESVSLGRPEASYQPPASSLPSYESGPSSGAGMPSFADSLSGGYGQLKQGEGFMPKSYRQRPGTGMPSYFDSFTSGFGSENTSGLQSAPAPTYETSAVSESSAPPAPSYGSGPSQGAGMASFADTLSGGYGQSKEPSYMPKLYRPSAGSGMASHFDSMPESIESPSYPAAPVHSPPAPAQPLPAYQPPASTVLTPAFQPPPVPEAAPEPAYQPPPMPSPFDGSGGSTPTPVMASFANSLSGENQNTKQSGGFMPKSYKQSFGSGMPSYFDALGSIPASNLAPPAPAGVMTRKPMTSDQSAELLRNPSPPKNGPALPQGHVLRKPQSLKCDQTQIMREGEAFLPHAMDPVVKRGSLQPDQSNEFKYFFTGRLCATEDFQKVPIRRFPSDQERAEIQSRRTLMYFQQGARLGRGPE